jgi:hypothetical protein
MLGGAALFPCGAACPGGVACPGKQHAQGKQHAHCPGGGQHTRKSSILRGSSMLGEHHNMVLKASFHEIEEHFVSGFECDNQLQILLGTAHRKRVQERWCITVTQLPCNTLALLWNGVHCKKELAIFPSPAGMSLTKLSLGGKKLNFSRPGRVWSVTSRLGTGKRPTLFYSVEAARQSNTDPSFRNFFWEGCCVCGVIVCFKINPCG